MFEFLDAYPGQLAGLATSLLWTATMVLFTAAGRRIGVTALNTWRLMVAVLLLGLTHRLMTGTWVPVASVGQVFFLAASGVIGLSLGDQALFMAFVRIGPRMSALIMATSPLMAALLGWIALGETLHGWAWIGVTLTIGGVAWVVLERPRGVDEHTRGERMRGAALALIGAACQACGSLLSKQGIGHGWLPEADHLKPQAATLIRITFAAAVMIPVIVLHRRRQRRSSRSGANTATRPSRRTGYVLATYGAFVGPFLGVWMSLIAFDSTNLGVAQSLCSLTPIFLLPVVAVLYKEPISRRAVAGAVIAVTGSALLFI